MRCAKVSACALSATPVCTTTNSSPPSLATMSSIRVMRCSRWPMRAEQKVAAVVAERVVDLLELIDVDEMHGDLAAGGRQHRERAVQPFDQPRAIGKAGQRVVMGEESDAPVGLLLLPRATVPGDRRHAEGEPGQHAKRNCGQYSVTVETIALRGLIDESSDDRDLFAIDDDGHERLGKMVGSVVALALPNIDDRLSDAAA